MSSITQPPTIAASGPLAIKSVADLNVEGRRVFVRVDFNVPLTPSGGVADDSRIRASVPTLVHLRKAGARIVIGSHLGRPDGVRKPELSLEPVGVRLAEILDTDVVLTDEPVGDGARKVVADLREGEIALLENLRFHPGEEANQEAFAHALASYADVYTNDAFGTAHRAHASTVGMVALVGEKGAGFLMLKEIEFLTRLLGEVARPYLAIVGGAKVSDKLGVLASLAGRVDTLLIGGAMANTFLLAQGYAMGQSRTEEAKLAVARSFLKRAKEENVRVQLPIDLRVADSVDAATYQEVSASACPDHGMALDIGEKTQVHYADLIARARTIFWNGPMGVFEKAPFAAGTFAVAKAVADNARALSVVGGGDSVAALEQAGVAERITHISTGGGASLEFIEGKRLPGIAALAS